MGRGADERSVSEQRQLHGSCYTTRCDFIFRWRRGQPATDNQMPQRYDSRAASSSDCTSCSTTPVGRARALLPVSRAARALAARGESWWVATHAASSLGESTLRNLKVALACADARRWHHGPHGVGDILAAWSNPRATQSPGVPSCAATKRPPSNPRAASRMQHVGDPAAARTGARRGRPAPGPAAGQGRGDGLCARCRSVTF